MDRRLTFYPFRTNSYVGDVGKLRQGRQPMNGTIWGKMVPSLSNGVGAAPPPAGGGGWDHVLFERKAFGLVTCHHPGIPTAATR